MRGGRGNGARFIRPRVRRIALLVVPVARVVVSVGFDRSGGSGQMMDRVNRAVEAVDPEDESRGQEGYDKGSGRSEQA
jgi:hypothetical protein